MKKILLLSLLSSSLIWSEGMTVLNDDEDGDIAHVMIHGNGEECKLYIDSLGGLIETDCKRITNSKKVQILCTKRKKICKTLGEVQSFISPSNQDVSYKDCLDNSGGTTYKMKECNGKELVYQDKLLNKYYKIAIKQRSQKEQGVLKKAQRSWISYRDNKCNAEGEAMRGGTGEGLLIGSCLIDMTKTRANELKSMSIHR